MEILKQSVNRGLILRIAFETLKAVKMIPDQCT